MSAPATASKMPPRDVMSPSGTPKNDIRLRRSKRKRKNDEESMSEEASEPSKTKSPVKVMVIESEPDSPVKVNVDMDVDPATTTTHTLSPATPPVNVRKRAPSSCTVEVSVALTQLHQGVPKSMTSEPPNAKANNGGARPTEEKIESHQLIDQSGTEISALTRLRGGIVKNEAPEPLGSEAGINGTHQQEDEKIESHQLADRTHQLIDNSGTEILALTQLRGGIVKNKAPEPLGSEAASNGTHQQEEEKIESHQLADRTGAEILALTQLCKGIVRSTSPEPLAPDAKNISTPQDAAEKLESLQLAGRTEDEIVALTQLRKGMVEDKTSKPLIQNASKSGKRPSQEENTESETLTDREGAEILALARLSSSTEKSTVPVVAGVETANGSAPVQQEKTANSNSLTDRAGAEILTQLASSTRRRPQLPLKWSRSRVSKANRTYFEPSEEEIKDARTHRAKAALHTWYERLNDLWGYREVHGNCRVPQKYPENPSLGIWVNKQRMEYRYRNQEVKKADQKCSLTEKKIAALEEVGFEWAKPKGDISWELRFQELLEYKKREGDCLVHTKCKENSALGRWVSTQRSQYKKWSKGEESHMTQERVDKLNEAGFTWTMMP